MRMSHATRGLLFAVLALGVLLGASSTAAKPNGVERAVNVKFRGEYVSGQVILGFRRGASRADFARVPARVTQRFGNLGMEVVELGQGVSVQQAIKRYERDPAVAFAEPNYIRHVNADLTSDLWGLNNIGQSHPVANGGGTTIGASGADINAPEAWATTKGSAQTVIAVIDTGVDVSHVDLASQLWTNPGETAGDGLDNDHNGKIDDVHGWDFSSTAPGDNILLSSNHWEGWDHGTHVAGTIAGDDDNDGVVGVCPGCKIMVLKIARDSDGRLMASAEIAALSYAKAHGVKIANMSFGGSGWTNSEREAIRTSGLLAVVSAGNDALDNDMFLAADTGGSSAADIFSPSYPASFTLSNILAVGAMNDHNENGYSTDCFKNFIASKAQCAFTNWGHDSVDLAAPGVDVESSVPGGYATYEGTSMAAPHVAGTAGLVLSQHPTYSVAQLKNAVMHSVDKPANLKTLYIPSYVAGKPLKKTGAFSRTTGRVDANKALAAGTSSATPATDGNIGGAKSFSGASVTGAVSWPADINDVKKKKLSKGHFYRITLAVPKGKDYDLYVWKPGTKEIWQPNRLTKGSAHGGSVDEVVQFTAGSTGVYYIHVSAWLFKSGSYKLTVKKLI